MIGRTYVSAPDTARYEQTGQWTDATLDRYLRSRAHEQPDALAIVDRGVRFSYREFDELVVRSEQLLTACEITYGDVVAWQMPNRIETLALHHAIVRIGAISVPIIPIYRHKEVEFILRQSGAVAYFATAEFRGFSFADMIDELAPGLAQLRHTALHDGQHWNILGPKGSHDTNEVTGHSHTPAASDVVAILYTSGTTSDPKGVLHTHQTLDYENRSMIGLWGAGSSDVVFMPSPVAHITGLLYGMHLPFMIGGSVVLQDIWDTGGALDLIETNRCTILVGATPFFHGLLTDPTRPAHDLSSLRIAACGGADVPPQLVGRFEAEIGAMTCRIYGSTEFPTLSGANTSDPLDKRADTDGRPIGFAQARIVDGTATQVDRGCAGALQVKGPELFAGYLDATLNEEAFDDGWFRTGDVALIDESGYVTIVGREKDIIIRGGENISAREIEDLLFSHPKVSDVAVVAMPDEVMVERVCAYVVPSQRAGPTVEDLARYLERSRIAKQKWPERVEIVTTLPRTPSGKVQKFLLRQDIAGKLTAENAHIAVRTS